jgi:hypothetical protein
MTTQINTTQKTFSGLLAGLLPGQLQARGLLDVVALFPAEGRADNAQYVSPLQHLKLVRVVSYGTLILRNEAQAGMLVAPMHIGFFQAGAQNHATSRTLILEAKETLTVDTCFCIQAAQGGFLKEAQQRFIILPLGLRKEALLKRTGKEFSRLWSDIDTYNRSYGIVRGGHLERFLRPYFARLQPFRHTFEMLPQQVGAAYFVAGNLVGVEVMPNAACWEDVGPILNIYSYGPAVLLAERQQFQQKRHALNLAALSDLNDLAHRLEEARAQDEAERISQIGELAAAPWKRAGDGSKQRLLVEYLQHQDWVGQLVRHGNNIVYLSVFRDLK